MRTIAADFNAMTESGHLRLGSRGSREDLRDQAVHVGDWMWLSDGEVVVGAQLASDDRYGLVGIPRWKTLVHLDDFDPANRSDISSDILELIGSFSQQPDQDQDDWMQELQTLMIADTYAPKSLRHGLGHDFFARRLADVLESLGEPALALVEYREAMKARPGDPNLEWFYLDLLRETDPDRAVEEALRADRAEANAKILAACINILSEAADRASDDEFQATGPQILDRIARFDRAPGRDNVPAWLLMNVRLHEGMTLLRLGRLEECRNALQLAAAINSKGWATQEALPLESERLGDYIREIAAMIPKRHKIHAT